MAQPSQWPLPFKPGNCLEVPLNGVCQAWGTGDDATLMASIWSGSQTTAAYNGKTLMQVLWLAAGLDVAQAGSHLIAALLNWKSGKVSADILPKSVIIAMGDAVLGGNLYTAAPGVQWTAAQVVTYIKQTLS
jgi:hypothetical protein